jgi:hypothetical protein
MIRRLPAILQALLVPLIMLHVHGASDSSSTVEFRVTRFDPLDGKSPEFRAGEGEASTSFEVPLTYIAGPFKATLREGIFLDLWRGDGEKPEISVRILPAEHKDLLLVFVPKGDGFRLLKIPTPSKRIKGGDRLVVNATPADLALKLGDMAAIRIAPGASGILKGPSGNEIVSLPALVSRKVGDKWKLASTENWPCDPRFRKILFAYMDTRSRQLSFHAVSEAVKPVAGSSETEE